MGKTRNLTKLEIDSNGDVAAGSLDNVPPSDDASALTTGTLDIARIADGAVTAAKLASTLDLTGKTVTLPAGVGGKVLQVVSALRTTNFSTTSTSLVDVTDLSVSITPSSASNKILILFSGGVQNNGSTSNTYVTLLRGATNLAPNNSYFFVNSAGTRIISGTALNYLDSPNTTSSTTYKIQTYVESPSTGTFFGGSSIIAMEIAA